MNKIISAHIAGEMSKSFHDPMPRVIVTFEDETTKVLFEFYPDEISFTATEFIGLIEDKARNLKFVQDQKYLQS